MESIENTKGRVAAGHLRQEDWLPDQEREIADRDVIIVTTARCSPSSPFLRPSR